jgi:hypothetical protein
VSESGIGASQKTCKKKTKEKEKKNTKKRLKCNDVNVGSLAEEIRWLFLGRFPESEYATCDL